MWYFIQMVRRKSFKKLREKKGFSLSLLIGCISSIRYCLTIRHKKQSLRSIEAYSSSIEVIEILSRRNIVLYVSLENERWPTIHRHVRFWKLSCVKMTSRQFSNLFFLFCVFGTSPRCTQSQFVSGFRHWLIITASS